ncbi:MAG: MFS transporter [Bacteroidota bacterium]
MKRIFSRVVITLSLVSFFTDIASEMLYPVMPIYLKSIGFTALLIGILEGIAEATAGLSKGYFGELSDRLGKRVIFIRWGYFLSALSKPAMAISKWPVWIFIARTTDRMGKGLRTSARDALLSDESTPETRGKVFGFHRGMDTLGAAVGPAIALLLLWLYPSNYTFIFLITIIPGLAAVLLTFLLREKAKEHIHTDSKGIVSPFSFLKYWNQSPVNYRHIVIGLIIFTLINSSDAFLLLKVKESGASDTMVIGLYIFYNLTYALLSYPMGWISDKLGMKRMVIFGITLYSITYLGFALTTRWSVFIFLFGLYSLYAASTEGVLKAWLANNLPKTKTATGIGLYNSLQSVATLIASSMAGLIWVIGGSSIVFVISAVGAALAGTYLFIFTRTSVTYPENE